MTRKGLFVLASAATFLALAGPAYAGGGFGDYGCGCGRAAVPVVPVRAVKFVHRVQPVVTWVVTPQAYIVDQGPSYPAPIVGYAEPTAPIPYLRYRYARYGYAVRTHWRYAHHRYGFRHHHHPGFVHHAGWRHHRFGMRHHGFRHHHGMGGRVHRRH